MDWNLFAAFVAVLISLAISAVLLYVAGVFKKDTPPTPQPPSPPPPPSPNPYLDVLQVEGELDGRTLIVSYGMLYSDIAPSDVHVLISSSNGSITQTIPKGNTVHGEAKVPLTGQIPSSIDYTVTLSGGRNLSVTRTAVPD